MVIPMSVYHDVIMVDNDVGYAIGQSSLDEGTYKYRIPQGWNCFSSQTWPDSVLYTGAYTSPDTGFMTGDTGGDIFKTTDGSQWETISTGISAVFYEMVFETSQKGWIVGAGGLVLQTDDEGESWQSHAPDLTEANLLSVAYKDGGIVVAVGDGGTIIGDGGTIIESEDGGETFAEAVSGVSSSLNGVCFSEDRAVIVGYGGIILQKGF